MEEPPQLLEDVEELEGEHREGLLWAEENAALSELPHAAEDAGTVSLDLRRVLSGAASYTDMELSDSDFHAIALQEELCEDVSQLDLAGIQALAYAFIAKFGSLKKAFKYFDTNKQGRFGQVVWDNGLVLLRIDVERLSGFRPAQIFHMMDQEPQGGSVSKKKWNRFFSAVEEGILATSMKDTAKVKGTLQQRAASKSEQFRSIYREKRKANGPRKPRRKGSSCSSIASIAALKDDAREVRKVLQKSGSRRPRKSESQMSQRSKVSEDPALIEKRLQQEDAFRQKALEELGELMKGDAMTYLNDCFKKWKPSENALDPEVPSGQGAFELLHAEEKCEIVEEISDELGLWRLPRAEAQSAKGSFGRSATMAFLKPGETGGVGGAVLVCHLRLFADATNEQLNRLQGSNWSLEFPSTLSEIQRVVVHVLAATKGLTTLSEGTGAARRLVAYDTGTFAQELRRKLSEIQPGQSKVLSEDFSAAQRRLVHTMAMEMGLDVKSRGTSGYEVFNLMNFREELQEELMNLDVGKVHHFGASLSEQERQVVHETAMHLGLTAHTEGGRTTRHVTVANLKDFIAAVRARMAALLEPEDSDLFENLAPMQIVAVENTAAELGLHCARRPGGSVLVSMSEVPGMEERRPSVNSEEDSQSRSKEVVKETEDDRGDAEGVILTRETSQASLINMIFEAYSSGNYRGQRTFLRFSDLKEFAEDMKELMPDVHKTFHHFTGLLEFYYDDTQQLQSDMGDHGAKGLTLRYFQVFVQKVLRRLGPQIVGVLFALIDQRPSS